MKEQDYPLYGPKSASALVLPSTILHRYISRK